MCGSGIDLTIYAELSEPEVKVEHEKLEERVAMVVGRVAAFSPQSQMHLWMNDPEFIIRLGNELIEAGVSLGVQLSGCCQVSVACVEGCKGECTEAEGGSSLE